MLVLYMLISNIIDYLMLAMSNMRKINCQVMSESKLDHFLHCIYVIEGMSANE